MSYVLPCNTYLLLALTLALGCGSDSGGSGSDGSAYQLPTILGANPTEYSEVNEVENNSGDTPEDTEYTQTAEGIAILGNVESGDAPSRDNYLFQTGSFGRVDIQVSTAGPNALGFNLTLDAFVDDGLSTLNANSYEFKNAFVTPGRSYVISVTTGGDPAGGPYRLEMKGNP